MTRPALLVALLAAALCAAVSARAERDGRDREGRGALSLEDLRREPIACELDVPYADTGNPRHRLDLYLPKHRARERLPVIVYFHGGAWRAGDESDGAGLMMPLLRTGHYAGVSAAYRLSGAAIWPAQIHDCKAAIRWVRANAGALRLRPRADRRVGAQRGQAPGALGRRGRRRAGARGGRGPARGRSPPSPTPAPATRRY